MSCASLPLLVPNPPRTGDKEEPRDDRKAEKPGRSEEPASAQKLQEKAPARGDDIDFSLAFAEAPVSPPEKTRTPPVVNEPVPVFTESTVGVPTSRIRVAIRQGSVPVSLYVMGAFEVRSASLPQPIESRGRIAFVMNSGSRIALSLADAPSAEVAVPCTLALLGEAALFDFGQESYRGSFHIHGGSKPVLVNHIDMEEYLRGVLPLEMGKVQKEEIEALKAQAVAARTYAYNRIVERVGKPFDVVRTIADQVYGGVTVETSEADAAIAATKGLVLAWQDSLARVYFHSTCGGRTATVNEIWENRPFCSYLSAMDDTDGQGVPYCSISPRFTWKESWSADQVSKILHATVGKTYPGKRFNGRLQAIVVRERLPCGRIQSCILESSAGDAACGGDKLRFVLRRKSATGYLLRSANFEVIENGPDRFTLEGKGYGHGVGMCQMGAIGRARQGQTFREILSAYYRGARISSIDVRR